MPETATKLEEIAKDYAIKCHESTNHKYDGKPYEVHLSMAVAWAHKFIHLIPESDRGIVLSAIWCHDVTEDCRETYNDVKFVLGEAVADIVYAVTNEKGKTRAERANEKYYKDMHRVKYANFVKLCDRLANVKYSKDNGSSMFDKYKRENKNFIDKVCTMDYESMDQELTKLLNN